LIIIGACLELVGLSLILPVIDVIQNQESNIYKKIFSNSNNEFNKIFQNSNLIFVILFFVYFFKNIFLAFLTWSQFIFRQLEKFKKKGILRSRRQYSNFFSK